MRTLTNQYRLANNHGAKKQAGATLLGMLFVGGLLVFVAMIAIKILPAYQEYFSVKSVMKSMHKEPLNSMMPKEIIDSFDGHAGAGYVTVISGADLVIGKSGGETVVSAKYQVVKPLFGNLSVLMDFEAASNSK